MDIITICDLVLKTPRQHAQLFKQVHHDVSVKISYAQDKYKVCQLITMLEFKVRDKVWLICSNIMTTHPCNILFYQRLCPFNITAQKYWLQNHPTYTLPNPRCVSYNTLGALSLIISSQRQLCLHCHEAEASRYRTVIFMTTLLNRT